MVTRNLYKVSALTQSTSFMVNGFLTAYIDVNVTAISGSRTFGIYGSSGDNATSSSPRLKTWMNGVLYERNITIDSVGKYRIVIDLTNVKTLCIIVADSSLTLTGTCDICFIPFAHQEIKGDLYLGQTELVYDVRDKKQIDIAIHKMKQTAGSANRYIRFYVSDDGITWNNSNYFICEEFIAFAGWVNVTDVADIKAFANVENTNYVKVMIDCPVAEMYKVTTQTHADYVENRQLTIPIGNNTYLNQIYNTLQLKGYRYFKIGFKDTVKESSQVALTLYKCPTQPVLLDGNYNDVFAPYNVGNYIWEANNKKAIIFLEGTYAGGSVVLDFGEGNVIAPNILNSGTTSAWGNVVLTLSNKKYSVDEDKVVDKADYSIVACKHRIPSTNRDCFGCDVIEYNSNTIYWYQYGYNGLVWKFDFTSDYVEELIEGEAIRYAYLIPFDKDNVNRQVGSLRLPNRIVIFTTKNRILHNCSVNGYDYNHFKESKLTNPFKQWQAVNDLSKVDAVHKYFPVLKNYDYDQFENRGAAVVQGTTVGTLLHDFLTKDSWSIRSYNSIARANKACLFANYNNGHADPMVIATVDGGKTWGVVMWFGFVADYPSIGTNGGEIDLTPISSQAAYTANSLKMCLRKYRVPTDEIPEPANTFIIDANDQVDVASFGVDAASGTVVVNLATSMDFGTYSPIVFFKNNGGASVWDYICNNDMTEDGANSNGIFFRLQKVTNSQYKLYANVGNPYEKLLTAFHLHCINRTCAGFIISTGESYSNEDKYEGGFIYFLTCNYNNGTNTLPNGLADLRDKTIRLTTSPNGVNRACGAYLFNDNIDPTLMYVSDESFYTTGKRNASIPNRTIAVQNVPTGIFRGKLSDIDDQSKYECVCDAKSTIVSLCEWMGHFAADGHGDALCLSKDGKNWNIETNINDNTVNGTDVNGNIYFGAYKVIFK